MTQKDMVLTQFAFIGILIKYPVQLGFHHIDDEMECLVHFWRYIGYALGIEDKYNLCSGSLHEVKLSCDGIMNRCLIPHMHHPCEASKELSSHLLTGMQLMVHPMTPGGFTAFTYKLVGVPYDMRGISDMERFLYKLQVTVMGYCLNHYITRVWLRPLLNYLLWLAFNLASLRDRNGKFPHFTFNLKLFSINPGYSLLNLK